MRRARPDLRREDGVTLIELTVVMALLGLLFGAFSLLLSTTIRDGGTVEDQSVVQAQTRAAIDVLGQDLREAYTGDTSAPILSMSGTALTFLAPDRAQPFHLRQISYQLVGGQLQRSLATSTNTGGPPWTIPASGPWATQVSSIVNPAVFAYQDNTGATTTNPALVSRVLVTVTVSPRGSQGRQFTYSTSATLRKTQ